MAKDRRVKTMTKEKKIEIIKRNIETIKNHLKIPIVDECADLKEQLKYELSIYERELKLLQIEARTIETVKIGDIVIFEDKNIALVNYVSYKDNKRFVLLVGTNDSKYLFPYCEIKPRIIIPREFLELCGEINA